MLRANAAAARAGSCAEARDTGSKARALPWTRWGRAPPDPHPFGPAARRAASCRRPTRRGPPEAGPGIGGSNNARPGEDCPRLQAGAGLGQARPCLTDRSHRTSGAPAGPAGRPIGGRRPRGAASLRRAARARVAARAGRGAGAEDGRARSRRGQVGASADTRHEGPGTLAVAGLAAEGGGPGRRHPGHGFAGHASRGTGPARGTADVAGDAARSRNPGCPHNPGRSREAGRSRRAGRAARGAERRSGHAPTLGRTAPTRGRAPRCPGLCRQQRDRRCEDETTHPARPSRPCTGHGRVLAGLHPAAGLIVRLLTACQPDPVGKAHILATLSRQAQTCGGLPGALARAAWARRDGPKPDRREASRRGGSPMPGLPLLDRIAALEDPRWSGRCCVRCRRSCRSCPAPRWQGRGHRGGQAPGPDAPGWAGCTRNSRLKANQAGPHGEARRCLGDSGATIHSRLQTPTASTAASRPAAWSATERTGSRPGDDSPTLSKPRLGNRSECPPGDRPAMRRALPCGRPAANTGGLVERPLRRARPRGSVPMPEGVTPPEARLREPLLKQGRSRDGSHSPSGTRRVRAKPPAKGPPARLGCWNGQRRARPCLPSLSPRKAARVMSSPRCR